METVIYVNGMMCTHCKASVEKALMAVPGTESVEVDLKGKTATVMSTNMSIIMSTASTAIATIMTITTTMPTRYSPPLAERPRAPLRKRR